MEVMEALFYPASLSLWQDRGKRTDLLFFRLQLGITLLSPFFLLFFTVMMRSVSKKQTPLI